LRLRKPQRSTSSFPQQIEFLKITRYAGFKYADMSELTKNSGGGAATQGGIGFQNHVAAWVGVMMLAERPATPIGPAVRPIYLRFETPEPTDDLLVGCSDGSHAFGQAKRGLNLSTASSSEFASVIEQFVRQYLSSRNGAGPRPWQHPLNPLRDSLF
jgi:hypothetical protein